MMVLSIPARLSIVAACLIVSWYVYGIGTTFNPRAELQQPKPHGRLRTLSQFAYDTSKSTVRKKLMLFASGPYLGMEKFGGIKEAAKLCPQCEFTHDRGRWNESDAIFFNGLFLGPKVPFKAHGQIWIYYFRESLTSMKLLHQFDTLMHYKNVFNWTATYRLDSDILMPTAHVYRVSNADKFDEVGALQTFKNKTRLVAWIVSHCQTSSKREELVKKLSQHVSVDIYGRCGSKNCTTDRAHSSGRDCRDEIATKYKFYLSFENSLCQDYVTETFFDILDIDVDMVPIVYGLADYTALGAPVGSYIKANDFETVKELADHILWLDQHPEEYVKYLRARAGIATYKRYEVEWCNICEKLWDQGGSEQIYEDLRDWWSTKANGEPMCIPPLEIAINK